MSALSVIALSVSGLLPQQDPDAAYWLGHLGDPKRELSRYFATEVRRIESRKHEPSPRADRIRFHEMLGLDPQPELTPLRAKVTGTLRAEALGIEVDKLHFQSRPGLYVTANLYRPAQIAKGAKLPAILYLCGHGRQIHGGYSYGNKTHYRRHATWFARHGFVCLIVDTLQLGEARGLHAGTLRHKQWDWVRRGYTPAGVEAWNAVRALDYLESLSYVDGDKIGVTGRSGGGVGTWYLAAIDERPKVLVPVAGLTDLRNHVVDGCIDGHCDCNYFLNYYQWNFGRIAALAAPRPLLLANSDRDRIFPLDGVMRLHRELEAEYARLGARQRFGLSITPGPHSDTPELRVPAFRWMLRHLKGAKDPLIDPAPQHFTVQQLRVFDALPKDAKNATIHQSFVAEAQRRTGDVATWRAQAWQRLLETTFRSSRLPKSRLEQVRRVGAGKLTRVDFVLHTGDVFRLPVRAWTKAGELPRRLVVAADRARPPAALVPAIEKGVVAFVAVTTRGSGMRRWSRSARDANLQRRRFLVLGRTLDQTRIHDLRALVRALPKTATVELVGGELALFAAVFETRVRRLRLEGLPKDPDRRLALPGLRRIVHEDDLLDLLPSRVVLDTR